LNLQTVYSLAVVLTRSQVRGTQRNKFLARVFGEPRIILPVDAALLLGLGAIGNLIISRTGRDLRDVLMPILPKALAGIPSAIMFMAILFGVLYEISQPIQSLNTDLVNWLPITPTEYVAGSTISESYIYSFVLCLLLGVVLGPALAFGMGWTWLAAAALSVLALFVAAFVVEILDATTNRISSSFYKKSGRSGIIFRLIATVIILVFIQLLFSGYIIDYLLQSIIQAALFAWFVPVVWPSLAVLGASQGSTHNFVLFSASSVIFAAALFALAAQFRARFWVPVPVSIKLSTGTYRPATFRLPLVGPTESALIQKDLRSLTRRREMARFLAIPFVLAISMGISLLPLGTGPTTQAPGFLFIAFLYTLPLAIFVGALSMTSIGQEGYAVWNLYAAPIKPSQILRAKVLFATSLGLAFGIGLLTILAFLMKIVAAYYGILLLIGILVVLEASMLGVYFAARFPDFREMVRSRYVGVWGSLLGVATAFGASLLTIGPCAVSVILYGELTLKFTLATVALGCIISIVGAKLALRQITDLFTNIRI
jgi:hypothetical protein